MSDPNGSTTTQGTPSFSIPEGYASVNLSVKPLGVAQEANKQETVIRKAETPGSFAPVPKLAKIQVPVPDNMTASYGAGFGVTGQEIKSSKIQSSIELGRAVKDLGVTLENGQISIPADLLPQDPSVAQLEEAQKNLREKEAEIVAHKEEAERQQKAIEAGRALIPLVGRYSLLRKEVEGKLPFIEDVSAKAVVETMLGECDAIMQSIAPTMEHVTQMEQNIAELTKRVGKISLPQPVVQQDTEPETRTFSHESSTEPASSPDNTETSQAPSHTETSSPKEPVTHTPAAPEAYVTPQSTNTSSQTAPETQQVTVQETNDLEDPFSRESLDKEIESIVFEDGKMYLIDTLQKNEQGKDVRVVYELVAMNSKGECTLTKIGKNLPGPNATTLTERQVKELIATKNIFMRLSEMESRDKNNAPAATTVENIDTLENNPPSPQPETVPEPPAGETLKHPPLSDFFAVFNMRQGFHPNAADSWYGRWVATGKLDEYRTQHGNIKVDERMVQFSKRALPTYIDALRIQNLSRDQKNVVLQNIELFVRVLSGVTEHDANNGKKNIENFVDGSAIAEGHLATIMTDIEKAKEGGTYLRTEPRKKGVLRPATTTTITLPSTKKVEAPQQPETIPPAPRQPEPGFIPEPWQDTEAPELPPEAQQSGPGPIEWEDPELATPQAEPARAVAQADSVIANLAKKKRDWKGWVIPIAAAGVLAAAALGHKVKNQIDPSSPSPVPAASAPSAPVATPSLDELSTRNLVKGNMDWASYVHEWKNDPELRDYPQDIIELSDVLLITKYAPEFFKDSKDPAKIAAALAINNQDIVKDVSGKYSYMSDQGRLELCKLCKLLDATSKATSGEPLHATSFKEAIKEVKDKIYKRQNYAA